MPTKNKQNKLNNLLEQGAINQEEFDKLKVYVLQENSHNSKNSTDKFNLNEDNKANKFEPPNDHTTYLSRMGIIGGVVTGIILGVRYNSLAIFLVCSIIFITISLIVSRFIARRIFRNSILGLILVTYLLAIAFPIGNTVSYNPSNSRNTTATYHKCQFCKKVRTAGSDGLPVHTIEPDGIGLVFIYPNSSRTSGFCSRNCAIAYRSLEN